MWEAWSTSNIRRHALAHGMVHIREHNLAQPIDPTSCSRTGSEGDIAPLTDRIFAHSTPALYDRYMGPLLFEPYAKLVAERCAFLQPDRILEIAAGTGIVTRAVHRSAPRAELVATDINPKMLEFAAHALTSEHVSFQPADAQNLPFSDKSFDLVLCQFGVMFFPDKVRANQCASSPWPVPASHLQPP